MVPDQPAHPLVEGGGICICMLTEMGYQAWFLWLKRQRGRHEITDAMFENSFKKAGKPHINIVYVK